MTASGLYVGTVAHERLRPKRHRLSYRVFSLLLDLDELPALDRSLRLFGHNRRAVLSFRDADHGEGVAGGLRAWVEARLGEAGVAAGGAIRVLSYPRIFGYVFNPLSVFFCHGRDGRLAAILYEVSNTHGERHTYVAPVADGDAAVVRQEARKAFFVSPFMPMECLYRFRVAPPGEKVVVSIVESDAEGTLLSAVFSGRRRPLDDRALLRALLAMPLMTLKVIAGIHYEALRLWRKGAPVHAFSPAARRFAASVARETPR